MSFVEGPRISDTNVPDEARRPAPKKKWWQRAIDYISQLGSSKTKRTTEIFIRSMAPSTFPSPSVSSLSIPRPVTEQLEGLAKQVSGKVKDSVSTEMGKKSGPPIEMLQMWKVNTEKEIQSVKKEIKDQKQMIDRYMTEEMQYEKEIVKLKTEIHNLNAEITGTDQEKISKKIEEKELQKKRRTIDREHAHKEIKEWKEEGICTRQKLEKLQRNLLKCEVQILVETNDMSKLFKLLQKEKTNLPAIKPLLESSTREKLKDLTLWFSDIKDKGQHLQQETGAVKKLKEAKVNWVKINNALDIQLTPSKYLEKQKQVESAVAQLEKEAQKEKTKEYRANNLIEALAHAQKYQGATQVFEFVSKIANHIDQNNIFDLYNLIRNNQQVFALHEETIKESLSPEQLTKLNAVRAKVT